MDIREIYEGNIREYAKWIDRDVAENMSRVYFRGIAACDDLDDSLKAAMIWELKSVEKEEDTGSEIVWVYDGDREYFAAALGEYSKRISDEDVRSSFFEFPGMDADTEQIFAGHGFKLSVHESRDIRIPLKDFRHLSVARKEAPSYIHSLDSISIDQFNQGLIRILFYQNVNAPEDVCYLPKNWYDQRVSCCVVTDDKINGFLLVYQCPSGMIMPVLFYAVGSDSRYDLLDMMRFSIHSALAVYPKNTTVLIRRGTRAIRELVAKLFPGEKGEDATSGERTE